MTDGSLAVRAVEAGSAAAFIVVNKINTVTLVQARVAACAIVYVLPAAVAREAWWAITRIIVGKVSARTPVLTRVALTVIQVILAAITSESVVALALEVCESVYAFAMAPAGIGFGAVIDIALAVCSLPPHGTLALVPINFVAAAAPI